MARITTETDLLADAFYSEDYNFINHVTGKRPTTQEEAEQIINEYEQNPEGRNAKNKSHN